MSIQQQTIESRLLEIVRDELEVEGRSTEGLEPWSSLEDLGVDSLMKIEIMFAIEEDFGIEIEDGDWEEWTTVGQIATYLRSRGLT